MMKGKRRKRGGEENDEGKEGEGEGENDEGREGRERSGDDGRGKMFIDK